jgi:hypothetical protein
MKFVDINVSAPCPRHMNKSCEAQRLALCHRTRSFQNGLTLSIYVTFRIEDQSYKEGR